MSTVLAQSREASSAMSSEMFTSRDTPQPSLASDLSQDEDKIMKVSTLFVCVMSEVCVYVCVCVCVYVCVYVCVCVCVCVRER